MSVTVPNWAQGLLALGAGLEPGGCGVRYEDDRLIVFLQYMPRQELTVDKRTGLVQVQPTEPYAGMKKTAPGGSNTEGRQAKNDNNSIAQDRRNCNEGN